MERLLLDWTKESAKRMVNKGVGLALRKGGLASGLRYCPVML